MIMYVIMSCSRSYKIRYDSKTIKETKEKFLCVIIWPAVKMQWASMLGGFVNQRATVVFKNITSLMNNTIFYQLIWEHLWYAGAGSKILSTVNMVPLHSALPFVSILQEYLPDDYYTVQKKIANHPSMSFPARKNREN